MKCCLRIVMAGSLLALGIARAQTTDRVSVSSAGVQGDDDSTAPSISADGRYVAFESRAHNLVPGPDITSFEDIFVRDRVAAQTTRVSVNSAGQQANDTSSGARISADGRFVSFISRATNLAANDVTDSQDIFVHDRQSGQTMCVSVDPSGVPGNDLSTEQSLSSDGRFIAFVSRCSNLVAGDTNGSDDIFVRDMLLGQTIRVSVDSNGVQANNSSMHPAISGDGRLVVFTSAASNLVPNGIGNFHIYVHDRTTAQTVYLAMDRQDYPQGVSWIRPTISSDGRHAAFEVSHPNVVSQIFRYDLQTQAVRCVSVDSSGAVGSDRSIEAALSADGQVVAFQSIANSLVPYDNLAATDVFAHDTITGQTTLVSSTASEIPVSGPGAGSTGASLSADGTLVAFDSGSTQLVAGDTNGKFDVFVRDRGPERVTPFCESSLAACPCGNVGAEHHGCASLIYPEGGHLSGYRTPSVGADTFVLVARDVSGLTTLFYQGDAQMSATVLDDGLACVSGSLVRLGVRSNSGGVSAYPQSGDLSVSVRGMIPALGGTRYYQCWYRNALPFCTPATTNRTNGLIVVWAP